MLVKVSAHDVQNRTPGILCMALLHGKPFSHRTFQAEKQARFSGVSSRNRSKPLLDWRETWTTLNAFPSAAGCFPR